MSPAGAKGLNTRGDIWCYGGVTVIYLDSSSAMVLLYQFNLHVAWNFGRQDGVLQTVPPPLGGLSGVDRSVDRCWSHLYGGVSPVLVLFLGRANDSCP